MIVSLEKNQNRSYFAFFSALLLHFCLFLGVFLLYIPPYLPPVESVKVKIHLLSPEKSPKISQKELLYQSIKSKKFLSKPRKENLEKSDSTPKKSYFDFLELLHSKIQEKAIFPSSLPLFVKSGEVEIFFRLTQSGYVFDEKIIHASSIAAFNESALSAVKNITPVTEVENEKKLADKTFQVKVFFTR